MFKHYEQKTWKTNAHKIKLFICMILPRKLYTLNLFKYYVFCNESCIFCYSYFMFHYIPLNFLFFIFHDFLFYSKLVMQQKCLQQRCLWRKYKNPNIDIWGVLQQISSLTPYQHRDPIIEKVMKSWVLSFWTALIFNQIWSVHISQHYMVTFWTCCSIRLLFTSSLTPSHSTWYFFL